MSVVNGFELKVGSAVAVSVRKVIQDLLDFAIPNHPAQSHRSYAMEGDGNLKIAGFNIEEVVLLDLLTEGSAADLFNDPHAVVWVNHPITNVEITVTVDAHTGNSPRRYLMILSERRGFHNRWAE